MIGARSLHDSQWGAWDLAEDHSLLSIYGDRRMQRTKNIKRTGSDVEENPFIVNEDADIRIHHDVRGEENTGPFHKRPDQQRGVFKGADPRRMPLKQGGKFRSEDPRHVTVSWYSHFYIRPESPTQWEQRGEIETEPDHFRMMGFESDPDTQMYQPPPVKSDMSVLEKLSKMAEYGEVGDQSDLEVEGILGEDQFLLSQIRNGSISKAPGFLTETREFLSGLRRQSPLI